MRLLTVDDHDENVDLTLLQLNSEEKLLTFRHNSCRSQKRDSSRIYEVQSIRSLMAMTLALDESTGTPLTEVPVHVYVTFEPLASHSFLAPPLPL